MNRTLGRAYKDGVHYTLERRVLTYQAGWKPRRSFLFVITDDVGDLYAFPGLAVAEDQWKRMFGALAQQEAA